MSKSRTLDQSFGRTPGKNPGGALEVVHAYERMCGTGAKLVGSDGKPHPLPDTLHAFLSLLLSEIQAGHPVTVQQPHAALTTAEAGKLLGMSRQFLIGLLEKNEIPYHMVGTHRRLYLRDVLTYKAKRDSARTAALNQLARQESEEGIYHRVPDDFRRGQ